jgi:signal transduction histidine kinase
MVDCYPGIEKTDVFAALQRVMTSRQPERMVNEFTYADGSTAWFRLLIEPVPEGLCVLSLDVTSERAAADSHAAFRDRAMFALDAAGAGIWEHDLLADTIRWSETTDLMLGKPAGFERTFDEFRRLVHPDDVGIVDAAFARSIQQNEPYSAQFRVVWPDQSVHWQSVKGRVTRNAAGEPTLLTGIAIDITERKQLEHQLQQALKMEALGQLAGSVAHDFNNVLAAICGFGELVAEQVEPSDPCAADVAEILKAAESGRRLSQQLLAFSRQQPLEPKLMDVNDIVRASEGLLRQVLGKGVALETSLAQPLEPVYADEGQIQQVLVNLAVNARDAVSGSGRLLIQTSGEIREGDNLLVRGRRIPAGKYVVLTVGDTGTGMPPEVVTRMFEPFFTTKPTGKGTGLGLSTVYGIVRQSGGYIDVKSTPGIGTTFRIGLPRVIN